MSKKKTGSMFNNHISLSFVWLMFFFCVLLILPTQLKSQELNEQDLFEQVALQQAGLSGLGLSVIDGRPYFRTQAQPDIPLPGKFGLGLDLVVLIGQKDGKVSVLAEDGETWNNASTYMRVIRYLRYGLPSDSLYIRYGELDLVTIGHGFIMSGYSNHDRRGLRINLALPNDKIGVETVINNLAAPSIFGGRLFVQPLKKENGTFWRKLEFGVTYLTDIDPISIQEKRTPEETQEEILDELTTKPIQAIGFDIGIPIFKNNLVRTDIYSDLAFLNTKQFRNGQRNFETTTNGVASGIRFLLPKAIFKTEYRIFTEGFSPTIFDYTYEVNKGLVNQNDAMALNSTNFEGKDNETTGLSLTGFYSMLLVQPLKNVSLLGTVENYSHTEPKMYLGLTEDGLIPKLSFRAFYTKANIGSSYQDNKGKIVNPSFITDLFRLDEKSALTLRIGYEILEAPGGYPIEISVLRQFNFRPNENGVYQPIKKTSFEIGLKHAID